MRAVLTSLFLLGCAYSGAEAPAPGAQACSAAIDAHIAEELAEINAGERIALTIEEADWTEEQGAAVARATALLESHDRPVNAADLTILDRANLILASESVWDRHDDRVCEPQDTTFSLFCALRKAAEETLGEYQHRRTALQEVRFALEEATEGREYEHRLRDFNNDASTTLADVRNVIAIARGRVALRLVQQRANCTERLRR